MAHFAELDSNNIVQRTIVVSNANTSSDGVEKEEVGVAYCKSVFGEDTIWKQCSRSMRIRKIFPAPGCIYNEELDIFHNPSPFDSWIMNENGDWRAPYEPPVLTAEQEAQGFRYDWFEDAHKNADGEGWVLYTPQVIEVTEQPWPYSINVPVGSSATISATASSNKTGIYASLFKKWVDDIGEEEWVEEPEQFENSDENTISCAISTGICTDTSHSGEYKIRFFPNNAEDNIGNPVFSAIVTVTVTE